MRNDLNEDKIVRSVALTRYFLNNSISEQMKHFLVKTAFARKHKDAEPFLLGARVLEGLSFLFTLTSTII